MEEILASIRRIISEDDAPSSGPVEAAPAPTPTLVAPPPPLSPPPVLEPAPVAAKPPPHPEEDVLELTEPLDAPHASPPETETLGDLDVTPAAPTLPPPPPRTPPTATPAFREEPLLGSYAAEQSAGHFGTLARSVAMPKDGRTLEDLVRELLKPMLRDWLDTYLPAIVEARVQAEVERVSRRQDY